MTWEVEPGTDSGLTQSYSYRVASARVTAACSRLTKYLTQNFWDVMQRNLVLGQHSLTQQLFLR